MMLRRASRRRTRRSKRPKIRAKTLGRVDYSLPSIAMRLAEDQAIEEEKEARQAWQKEQSQKGNEERYLQRSISKETHGSKVVFPVQPVKVIDYKGLRIVNDLQYYRCFTQPEITVIKLQYNRPTVLRFPEHKYKIPPSMINHVGSVSGKRYIAPRSGVYMIKLDLKLQFRVKYTSGNKRYKLQARQRVMSETTKQSIWGTDTSWTVGRNSELLWSTSCVEFLPEGTTWYTQLENVTVINKGITLMESAIKQMGIVLGYTGRIQCILLKSWNENIPVRGHA